ncbi:MAG: hypothetical protein HUK22_08625, partial [Thermoguttaceae bacterium]|nr:hypothetical protein [Thermoguttaceae bacterium]
GLDLRRGCNNIIIENISGVTGDDVVALTAIGTDAKIGGRDDSTEVSAHPAGTGDFGDIHDVVVRNVVAHAAGGHQIIRLLNASGNRIYNVVIDGVVDTSPKPGFDRATIRIGDSNPAWGGVTPLGDTTAITISNVVSSSRDAVLIAGSLTDSAVMNVVNRNPQVRGVTYESGKENVRNVAILNFVDCQ